MDSNNPFMVPDPEADIPYNPATPYDPATNAPTYGVAPIESDMYMEETTYETYDSDVDDDTIKRVVGESISRVDGVLGLKGGFTDIFKDDEDLRRGISVSTSRDNTVQVSAKLIADSSYNAVDIINNVTSEVTKALQNQIGLTPERVNIEIAEGMTRQEFDDQYGTERALH